MCQAGTQFAILVEENIRNKNFSEAIRLCKNGLDVYPNYHSATILLATAYRFQGNDEEAKNILQKALLNYPRNISFKHAYERLHSDDSNTSTKKQEQLGIIPITAINFSYTETANTNSPDKIAQEMLDIADGLKNTKIVPVPAIDDIVQDETEEVVVATETFAKIYIKQQQYIKALKVYRTLMDERPERAEYYLEQMQKIKEQANL